MAAPFSWSVEMMVVQKTTGVNSGYFGVESGSGGGGMKSVLFPPLLVIAALIVSCSSFRSFQSDDYVKAGIQVATGPATLPDARLVKGWLSEYPAGYSARDVGVLAANELAHQGWRDVWVLVELSARNAFENEKEDPGLPSTADRILSPTSSTRAALLSIWRISIYRSTPPVTGDDTGGG